MDTKVPRFEPQTFGSEHSFARIGTGSVGGKAVGLQQILQEILPRFDASEYEGVTVAVPPAVVIATDVFSEFVHRNHLAEVALSGIPDSRIAIDFQRGELTEEVRSELRRLLEVLRAPLAVRPSSFLEDTQERPFAGIFASKLIPNSEENDDARYRRLSGAIKLAWASTFFENAVASRRSCGLADDAEKMAVIIQEITGDRYGGRFYPTVSGLARSYNHYPVPGNKREDGVVTVALGLGKTITDGDHVWSYCPSRATAPPPFKSTGDLLKFTQNSFWAVNVGEPPPPDPVRESSCLVRCGLGDAEADGTLTFLSSTWDPASDQLRTGISGNGPRALTFAPLLESRSIPFTPVMERLLELSCNVLNGEAEIEFAVNLDTENALPMEIGFVQLRPMLTPGERTPVEECDLDGDDVLVSSDNCLGQGSRDDLTDVVYLRPQNFDRGSTRMMASELDAVNRGLVEEGRHGVFIGLGRWGTTDDRFGVPVVWGQISAARVIVEATMPDAPSNLSHGTHFFHRLLSNRVLYMSVEAEGHGRIDWDFLDSQEAIWESSHVRHVRVDSPLDVRIDCANRRGLIRRSAD
ncbi:MAG: PEP/pyruvate-binding domain-containing protein [Acidobacteriota bacterium]|nr:PEP/pyruvate-binding domain-containing protein [Acidobacteriota bacterium]